VLATFLWQTLTVGVVASLAGAVLGATLQPVLIRLLAGFVPFTLEPRFEPLSLARGVLMGALTTFLCALWPLLAVRSVRPSLVLRPRSTRRPRAAVVRGRWPAGGGGAGRAHAVAGGVAELGASSWRRPGPGSRCSSSRAASSGPRGGCRAPRGRRGATASAACAPGGHPARVVVALAPA